MLKKSFIVIALLLVLVSSLVAGGKHGKCCGTCGGEDKMQTREMHKPMDLMMDDMLIMEKAKFALTDKQVKKIEEIGKRYDNKVVDLHNEITGLKAEKAMLMKKAEFSKAERVVKKIYNKKSAIAVHKLDAMGDIYGRLNAKQQKMFLEMDMTMMQKHNHNHKHGCMDGKCSGKCGMGKHDMKDHKDMDTPSKCCGTCGKH
jgi:Spy/CpxP family protein refolding chaperone